MLLNCLRLITASDKYHNYGLSKTYAGLHRGGATDIINGVKSQLLSVTKIFDIRLEDSFYTCRYTDDSSFFFQSPRLGYHGPLNVCQKTTGQYDINVFKPAIDLTVHEIVKLGITSYCFKSDDMLSMRFNNKHAVSYEDTTIFFESQAVCTLTKNTKPSCKFLPYSTKTLEQCQTEFYRGSLGFHTKLAHSMFLKASHPVKEQPCVFESTVQLLGGEIRVASNSKIVWKNVTGNDFSQHPVHEVLTCYKYTLRHDSSRLRPITNPIVANIFAFAPLEFLEPENNSMFLTGDDSGNNTYEFTTVYSQHLSSLSENRDQAKIPKQQLNIERPINPSPRRQKTVLVKILREKDSLTAGDCSTCLATGVDLTGENPQLSELREEDVLAFFE